jgi:hypothetical protein
MILLRRILAKAGGNFEILDYDDLVEVFESNFDIDMSDKLKNN